MDRTITKKLLDSGLLAAFANGNGEVECLESGSSQWRVIHTPNFNALGVAKWRVRTEDQVDPIDYETACKTIVAKNSTLTFEDGASDYKVWGIKRSPYNGYTLLVKSARGSDCEIYSHALDKYNCEDFPLMIRIPQYVEANLKDV